MPLVSVIVPVYNVEEYLCQCVDSILGQSFKDIEVILVDDGSTDSCLQICDDYAQSDFRVKVVHKDNGGSSSARNTGLMEASGEYVIFVDSDDYWCEVGGLQRLVDVATRENSEIVIFGYRKYFELSQSLSQGSGILESEVHGKSFLPAMHYLIANRLFVISAWNKLIKRSVLLDNEIIFVPGQLGEDLEWTLNLISCLNSVEVVDIDFYIYRQRGESISKDIKDKNVQDWLDTMTKWHAVSSSLETPPERSELCFGLLADAYLTMIYLYARLHGTSQKKFSRPIKSLDLLLRYKGNSRVRKVALLYSVLRLKGTSMLLYRFVQLKAFLKNSF